MDADMFQAVIEQAVKDARSHSEERLEAIKWLLDDDEDTGFLYICELLETDPNKVLDRLRKEGVL